LDRGEGRFHLPESMLEALSASMLPSLALLLHQRLAAILSRESGPPETMRASEPPRAEEAPPTEDQDHTLGRWPYADIFGRRARDAEAPLAKTKEPPAEAKEPPAQAKEPSVQAKQPPASATAIPPPRDTEPRPPSVPISVRGDDARAAGHLAAAGDLE